MGGYLQESRQSPIIESNYTYSKKDIAKIEIIKELDLNLIEDLNITCIPGIECLFFSQYQPMFTEYFAITVNDEPATEDFDLFYYIFPNLLTDDQGETSKILANWYSNGVTESGEFYYNSTLGSIIEGYYSEQHYIFDLDSGISTNETSLTITSEGVSKTQKLLITDSDENTISTYNISEIVGFITVILAIIVISIKYWKKDSK